MSQTSLSRKFARLTKPFRVSLGLAKPDLRLDTNSPFRRSASASAQASDRLTAIERDLDRLISGWNQHLPQILGAVGEARQVAREHAVAHQELEALRGSIEALQKEIAALSERLASPSDQATRSAPTPLKPSVMAARPSQGASGPGDDL